MNIKMMMFAPTERKPEGNQLRKEEALYFWRRFLLIALHYLRRLYTEKLTNLFFLSERTVGA